MVRLLVVVAVLGAGKADPKLAGTWVLAGEAFMTLTAGGTGVMDGERITWKTEGSTLVLSDGEDGEDRAVYALAGDSLTLTLNGIPLQLTRAGKGEASKPKGKLTQKLEAAQAPEPAQPRRAGSDQLSQLLLSSSWCYLRYASGNTYTQKVHFNANGTWSDASESDIYVSNTLGTAEANNARQSQGQWAVQNGQLLLSNPPETPQLTPIGLTITRNSKGSPILNADGREYSMCR